MLTPSFNLLNGLPLEILINIFEKAGLHPSICTVSKDIQRIMETAYKNLYEEYKKLNNSYLNQVIEKVHQLHNEFTFCQKVRDIYKRVIQDINNLPEGKAKNKESLARHLNLLSAQRLNELGLWHMEKEAPSTVKFFTAIAQSLPAAQDLLLCLHGNNAMIIQATSIKDWMTKNAELLQQITNLDLSNLRLTHLPKEIKYLTGLQVLNLTNNCLTCLPKEIGKLVKLKMLLLSQNQLTSLTEKIGKLFKLQSLFLNQNQLEILPKSIGNLVQLQGLFLSQNQLTNLTEEIGNLIQLQRLSLSQNQLEILPKSIGNLVQLKNLLLTDNRLTTLPKEFAKLIKLEILDLKNNQLKEIPKEILNSSLKVIANNPEIVKYRQFKETIKYCF